MLINFSRLHTHFPAVGWKENQKGKTHGLRQRQFNR